MNDEELRWLTWGAIHHRPHGAPKWDEPGTAQAIRERCGNWELDVATQHVLAHARDPKARTPFAIKGTAPSTEPTRAPRRPPKPADECRLHLGEWADACRICMAPKAIDDDGTTPATKAHGVTAEQAAEYVRQAREAIRNTSQVAP